MNETTKTEFENIEVKPAVIKVLGIGGAGNNIVSWLYDKKVEGATIHAINTDLQHLNNINADYKLLIGRNITKGLGCGGYPEKGREAAKESISEIKDIIKGSDMIFVCAGMGGGTGTGAAPVIAKIAKDSGAIVIGTVTMPFKIEGARIVKAEYGLKELSKVCDTVVVIDNNRLVQVAGNLPIMQAFAVANELIANMIKSIVEIIAVPSLVNLDFADIRAIMEGAGVAVIGLGVSDTEKRVEEAVRQALNNPLLEVDYRGAVGALIHIEGGPDLTLEEVELAGSLVTENLDDDANVIWGARINDDMHGRVKVMIIVTGVSSPWVTNLKHDVLEEIGLINVGKNRIIKNKPSFGKVMEKMEMSSSVSDHSIAKGHNNSSDNLVIQELNLNDEDNYNVLDSDEEDKLEIEVIK